MKILAALKELDITSNKFETLDLSDCAALESLYFRYNSFDSLDLSNLKALTYVDGGNNNKLVSLDISGCGALQELKCAFDYKLEKLNLKGCTSLQKLDASHCNFSGSERSYFSEKGGFIKRGKKCDDGRFEGIESKGLQCSGGARSLSQLFRNAGSFRSSVIEKHKL